MKRKSSPVKFVLVLMALVAAAGIISFFIGRTIPSKEHMDLNQYYGNSGDEIAVIAGADISKTFGTVLDGSVFLDYASVSSIVNPGVYDDTTENLLIVTMPTKKITLNIADGSASDKVRMVGDTLYISLDFLKTCTDMETAEYDNPKRVVIKNSWDYAAASVAAAAPVRYQAGIKSPILKDADEGTILRVLDVSADGTALEGKIDGWTHVASDDGCIGYIEDKYLGTVYEEKEEHTSAVGEYTHISENEKINMAFHQTTNAESNAALSESLKNVTGVNTIAPTWFFLNSAEGDMSSLASADYVKTAHDAGLKVWAVANDFDGQVNKNSATLGALQAESHRQKIIDALISGVQSSGADGINIDFENVTEECAPVFLVFLRELSIECRNAGLVLSVDDYVPTYTKYLNRKAQAEAADYIVCMCYDEHTSGSKKAGSVASLPFVEKGIKDTISEVPASQTIIAIPFFTRLWETKSSATPESTAMGMTDAQDFISEHNLTEYWDKDAGQNYAELQSSDVYYQIWLEDEASITEKMKLIQASGCAGAAEWKLGLEDSGIWPVISGYLQ